MRSSLSRKPLGSHSYLISDMMPLLSGLCPNHSVARRRNNATQPCKDHAILRLEGLWNIMSMRSFLSTAQKRFKNAKIDQTTIGVAALILIAIIPIIIYFLKANSCRMLEGATFTGGALPVPFEGDNGLMETRISFRSGTFSWSYTDMLISGSYECASGMITGQDDGGTWQITGSFDARRGVLIWNDMTYYKDSASDR